MVKVFCVVVLSVLALEICPTHHTTSPVVRSRVERTCNARIFERVARRMGRSEATAETVCLVGREPASERPVQVVLGYRARRRV